MIREDIHKGMVAYIKVCGNKPDVYTPDMCAEDLMEFLHSQGVAIKGEGLGVSHPHLAKYYAVEPLVEEV